MPLTTSHPAAVLPLARILRAPGALAALVIGSMVPDFIHFLPWSVPREEAHSKLGLFWFALPVGAVAYLAWNALIKRPALFLLPPGIRRRIRPELSRFPSLDSVGGAATILISLFVGALSHLVWDAFTHETGLVVREFPWLETAVDLGLRTLPLFSALYYASTVAGGLFVLGWIVWRLRAREPREPDLAPPFDSSARGPIAVLVVAAGLACGLIPAVLLTQGPAAATRDFLYHLYVKGVTGAVVALAGVGVLWWIREPGREGGRERARSGTV